MEKMDKQISKDIRGAIVTIDITSSPTDIMLRICINLNKLDQMLPDHSPHGLIHYINLPQYETGQSYWWERIYRTVNVKTGSQAQRVINNAYTKIDDAIALALLQRDSRLVEVANV